MSEILNKRIIYIINSINEVEFLSRELRNHLYNHEFKECEDILKNLGFEQYDNIKKYNDDEEVNDDG